MKKKISKKDLILDMTQEDYQTQLAKGIDQEAILQPGEHKFERGGFFSRHNIKPGEIDTSLKNIKIAISIRLDADILEHFKKLAQRPGSAPYQTLINETLRQCIENQNQSNGLDLQRNQLINDDAFIDAIVTKIKQREVQNSLTLWSWNLSSGKSLNTCECTDD
jgi:uncharacterized protein (DUF4415 family)